MLGFLGGLQGGHTKYCCYENVKELLEKVNHEHHNWDVCGEFKMLGFL
jgi:hypothetical protein